MRLSFLLIVCFSLTSTTVQAGQLFHQWSDGFGDESSERGEGVAVDESGNAVITGDFTGTIDFGGGPLVSTGSDEIFLAKFDANGNHVWSRRFGDEENESGLSVAADGSGNVLLTGDFWGTIDFGGDPLNAYDADIYLVKLDADANHQWSYNFGDSGPDRGKAVAADPSGNVLLTGQFQDSADFGGGPLTGYEDIFLVKFDPDGNHLWSQGFGDSEFQFSRALAVDGDGNVVIAGDFFGSIDFGGGPLTSAGSLDIYLAKFDPSGNHIWSQRFGDAAEVQHCWSVTTDADGNVLIAGGFSGSVDFGGGLLTSAGSRDICLAKFDPDGSHLWSQRFGDSDGQSAYGVASDGAGSALVAGGFRGTLDFGGGPLTGEDDIFLAKLDANGNHVWSQSFGGPDAQSPGGLAANAAGDVLMTGEFNETVDFGGGPLTSAGGIDVFLVKFGLDDPTPVLLSQVSVREVNLAVELSWVAMPDLDISSFEVHRATTPRMEESRKLAALEADVSEQTYRDETVLPGETYYYWIGVVDILGGLSHFGPFSISFAGSEESLLLGSYPNPVKDQTTIRFYVPGPGDVTLGIYDPTGRLVRTLVHAAHRGGSQSVVWDGTNQSGVPVTGGVYFYRLMRHEGAQTRRMILVR